MKGKTNKQTKNIQNTMHDGKFTMCIYLIWKMSTGKFIL